MTNTHDTPPDSNAPVTYYPLNIVQITSSTGGLYALAENGTVWEYVKRVAQEGTWRVLPPLPQHERADV